MPKSSSSLPSGSKAKAAPANVIVFGETGAGKSSVINMLGDDPEILKFAGVSSLAAGATLSSEAYPKTIDGKRYIFYDTIGLNEGSRSMTGAQEAISELFQLILRLDKGVNLLIYVMRAPRIRETAEINYDLFYNIICKPEVPIVIVLTNLEDQAEMDQWWIDNRYAFDRAGLRFSGSVCITASKGKFREGKFVYQDEYDDSRERLRALVLKHCSPQAWNMPPVVWYNSVIKSTYNLLALVFGLEPIVAVKELYDALLKYGGMTSQQAKKVADEFERGVTGQGRGRQNRA